jgi:hypothetical protein
VYYSSTVCRLKNTPSRLEQGVLAVQAVALAL